LDWKRDLTSTSVRAGICVNEEHALRPSRSSNSYSRKTRVASADVVLAVVIGVTGGLGKIEFVLRIEGEHLQVDLGAAENSHWKESKGKS
jgi:hypothetical protein